MLIALALVSQLTLLNWGIACPNTSLWKVKVNQLHPPLASLSLRWQNVYVLAFRREDIKYDKFYPDLCTPFVLLKFVPF
jgi:hypothetical protein